MLAHDLRLYLDDLAYTVMLLLLMIPALWGRKPMCLSILITYNTYDRRIKQFVWTANDSDVRQVLFLKWDKWDHYSACKQLHKAGPMQSLSMQGFAGCLLQQVVRSFGHYFDILACMMHLASTWYDRLDSHIGRTQSHYVACIRSCTPVKG